MSSSLIFTMGHVRVLTLPSNASYHLYPENRTSHYRVELAKRLNFDDGKYEVGLTAFHYPRTWYNLPNGGQYHMNIAHVDDDDDSFAEITIPIYPGYYAGAEQVKSLLNLRIVNAISQKSHRPKVKLDAITGKFDIHVPENRVVKISSDLAIKMGWPPPEGDYQILTGMNRSPGVARIDEVGMIFVNCDIAADYHMIGGHMTPLLQTVSVSGNHGDNVSFEPKHIHWLPLRTNSFTTAEIVISDAQGRLVPFEHGIASVQVQIRRVNPFS